MSFDDDYRLALELQMQFNESDNDVVSKQIVFLFFFKYYFHGFMFCV